MDVIEKIKRIAVAKGWSEYRLVKETGLASSTIANIYHRNTIPTIPTLEIICNTFGISLSQFFSENDVIALTPEQALLLEQWSSLSPAQREIFLKLFETL